MANYAILYRSVVPFIWASQEARKKPVNTLFLTPSQYASKKLIDC